MSKLFAESEHLLFYVPTTGDHDFFRELLSMHELTENNHKGGYAPENIEAAWTRTITHWEKFGYGTAVVYEKHTNQKIGFGGFKEIETVDGEKFIDIGGILKPEYHNKGYAFEAARLFLEMIFKQYNFDKVGSVLSPDNLTTNHLIKKLGYKYIKDTSFDKKTGV